jgi:hypothetical protein
MTTRLFPTLHPSGDFTAGRIGGVLVGCWKYLLFGDKWNQVTTGLVLLGEQSSGVPEALFHMFLCGFL